MRGAHAHPALCALPLTADDVLPNADDRAAPSGSGRPDLVDSVEQPHHTDQPRPPWRHPLQLASDYGADTPIWINGALLLDLDRLGIDEQLQSDLIGWQRIFEEHFTPTLAWDGPEPRSRYAEQGPALLDRLRTALPGVPIEIDLWPLEPDSPPS